MKKLFITLTALCAMSMGAWAESSQHEGVLNIAGILMWKMPAGGGTMTIYGDEYQPMRNYTSADDNLRHFATSKVGPKVKSIDMQKGFNVGNYAFSQLDSLESVTLHGTPSDVRYFPIFHIGDYAFAGSSMLASINSKNLTDLRYIGTNAFAGTAIKTFTINKPAGRELPQYAKQEEGFPVDLNREHCYIGENAFNSQCLNTVYMKDDTPFSDTYNNFLNDYAFLVVDNAEVAATYRTAWPEIAGRIVYLEETVPFTNEEVKEVCVNKWDTNGDGELNYEEIFAVTDFGDAFAGDTTITKIDGLEPFVNVTVIGSGTFSGCTALESITIPPHITDIADDAFTGCTNLKEIHFVTKTPQMENFTVQTNERTYIIVPDDAVVTYDSQWADKKDLIFGEGHIRFQCPVTEQICVTNWDTNKDGGLSYEEAANVTDIGFKFQNKNITSFDEFRYFVKVTKLDYKEVNNGSYPYDRQGTFFNCHKLESITIPANVTSITYNVFEGCRSLKRVVFEDGGDLWMGYKYHSKSQYVEGQFSQSPLEYLYLGRNISKYNSSDVTLAPFTNKAKLSVIEIGKTVSNINYNLSRNENLSSEELQEIRIHDLKAFCNISKNFSFSNCNLILGNKLITNLTLPEHASLKNYAFAGFNIESVIISDGITSIPTETFKNCKKLTSVTISNSVTSIGNSAFAGCNALSSINIPNSVTTIGNSAFSGCGCLISLPNNIVSIGSSAFENVPTVVFDAMNPTPTTYNSFSNIATFIVPDSAVSEYRTAWASVAHRIIGKTALNWKEVTCEAQPTTSHLAELIGEGNELDVLKLRIRGTINSYDMMVMRNKMQNLRELDLTNATIVANSYNYGTGVSEDNVFPDFMKGKRLTNILLPESITRIGGYALNDCDFIKEITIPDNVTSIDNMAFNKCDNLSALYVSGNSKLKTINASFQLTTSLKYVDLSQALQLETIGVRAFNESAITSISLPTSLKSIGEYAFYKCKNLLSFTTTANIGNYAFEGCEKMHSFASFGNIGEYAFKGCYALKTVTIQEGASTIGAYAFENVTRLETVNIGKGVRTISNYAFRGCSSLKTVSLSESLNSLGTYAFSGCTALTSITIPDAVTSLGTYAFNGCTALEKAEIGMGITSVPQNLFSGCTKLKDVKLSPKTTTIQSNAFQNCTGLTEFHLPPYLTSIGSGTFSGCSNLKEIYAYMPDVPTIAVSTFSNYSTSTLYAPAFLYNAYYYDSGWNQFLYVKRCDLRPGDYEAFYTNKDLYFKDGEERITEDKPIVELGNQGAIIVEGANQEFTTVDMERGTTSSSLIGDNNIPMEELRVKIAVSKQRWYFLCFPYDVVINSCTYPGKYAWREYDGAQRAANGGTGWKNVEGDTLSANKGYIFQSDTQGTLWVRFAAPTFGGDRPKALAVHSSSDAKNASWNFVGNPYTSYYNMQSEDFTAPITIWNGTSYVAYRPGDDDYHLQPFEAFFVQKPEGTSEISFDADRRETYSQSVATTAAQARTRMTRGINPERRIINIGISDNDTAMTDRTRLVLNQKASRAYEMECDAAKFLSDDAAVQIYTVEGTTLMSINERPEEGDMRLGYIAKKAGTYRLEAQRMDIPMVVVDNETGISFDLSKGAYSFTTKKGTFNKRFTLRPAGDATAILDITKETGVAIGTQDGGLSIGGAEGKTVCIYTVGGAMVAEQNGNGFVSLAKGTYVVTVDGKSAKVNVK